MGCRLAITPHFWYSPTFFSKKFVLPSSEMNSMKLNGFFPSSSSKRSATNSMYCDIRSQFMPSISTGSAFVRNSCSIRTASRMISVTRSFDGFCTRYLNIRQAKSQCSPSSREISSFEKVSPGIRPRFFSQKIAAKLPLKKIPSTAANATTRSPKLAFLLEIQFSAQSAFRFTHGSVSMALNRNSLQGERANEF
uniref:Uncharacterized protein n=1 Tax=Anopheles coluzzii TaxID=1518534 RepID=A0A8W7PH27_ANOCL